MRRGTLIAAVLLSVCAVSQAVTLQGAVSTALSRRGDVSAAAAEARSARWDERSADLWFLPSVSGTLAFQRSHDVQSMEVPGLGSIPLGSEYSSQAGIGVTVPLYVPQGPAGSGLASRATELSSAQLKATEMDAVVQVVQAYYGVLVAQELVAVAEEALSIAEEGYRLAQARYDAGTISRFELLQSRVAWENRIPEAISARSSLENARRGLSVSMGLADTVEMEVEGSLDDPVPGRLPEDLETARRAMEESSPDLDIARGLREVGDAGVGLARADLLPSLVFQTDYSYVASRDDYHFRTDDYQRSWSSTIALTVPIFTGLGDIAGYESARADRVSSYSQARSLEQGAGLSLVRAWNKLTETRQRVESTSATVVQAQEAAEIARVSYQAGTITRLAMDQAFLALTSARTNRAAALYDLRSAEIELMRAIGSMALLTERG